MTISTKYSRDEAEAYRLREVPACAQCGAPTKVWVFHHVVDNSTRENGDAVIIQCTAVLSVLGALRHLRDHNQHTYEYLGLLRSDV